MLCAPDALPALTSNGTDQSAHLLSLSPQTRVRTSSRSPLRSECAPPLALFSDQSASLLSLSSDQSAHLLSLPSDQSAPLLSLPSDQSAPLLSLSSDQSAHLLSLSSWSLRTPWAVLGPGFGTTVAALSLSSSEQSGTCRASLLRTDALQQDTRTD
uniref:Uncharacterized protein n=1 Tax=Knipowitschia caucasica TaxID=637954 RepID=A0AAV2K8Q1_KNICA